MSLYSNIHEVFDQFGITHAVMDITITLQPVYPSILYDDLADFLKIVHIPNAEPDMVVENEDDLIKVTIAPITQFAPVQSPYSELKSTLPSRRHIQSVPG